MGNDVCFLITILYEVSGTTLECALKVDREKLSNDCISYPMEQNSRYQLHKLLPSHVRSCGPIVKVELIYEVHVFQEESLAKTNDAKGNTDSQ